MPLNKETKQTKVAMNGFVWEWTVSVSIYEVFQKVLRLKWMKH